VRTFARVSIALLVLFSAWRTWARPPADEPHADAVAAVPWHQPSATGSQRSELDGSTVVVPPVTGLSGSYARDVLGSSGLRLGEIRPRSSAGPWGAVVSQSIDAGARVPRGTVIDLAVVRGSVPPCWPSSCGIPHGRPRRTAHQPT
jgi:PASTA domain-containing protein